MPLVGSSGLEPPTSRLSGVRSNHLSYEPISAAELLASCLRPALFCFPGSHLFRVRTRFDFRLTSYALCLRFQTAGGDERVRTDDPLLAKQVLSQLSYTPIFMKVRSSLKTFWAFKIKQRGTHTFQYAGLCLTLDVRSILRLTSSP